jgi:hypothetical protein
MFLCGQCGSYITSMKPVPQNRETRESTVTAEKSASLVRASMKRNECSELVKSE